MLRAPCGSGDVRANWLPAMPQALNTTVVSDSFAGVGNASGLDLLAYLASRLPHMAAPQVPVVPQPTQASRPAPCDAAFVERLAWCNPPLSVAFEWQRLPDEVRDKGVKLHMLSRAAGLQLPPHELVRGDALKTLGTTMLKYEQAAFAFSNLLPGDRHVGALRAIARDGGLRQRILLRYVPARELLSNAPPGPQDEAARRAGNLDVIRYVERHHPEIAALRVWKAAVEWCVMSAAQRLDLGTAAFASQWKIPWASIRHYATPGGDLTANVVLPRVAKRPGATESPAVMDERLLAPPTLQHGGKLTEAKRVAYGWYMLRKAGVPLPWTSLAGFARHNNVPRNEVFKHVTASGVLKRPDEYQVEAVVVEDGRVCADVPTVVEGRVDSPVPPPEKRPRPDSPDVL